MRTVPGHRLGHSGQNASNVSAEVKNYSTSHILATDPMREAETINLDNSVKFHSSEVINQFPYRTNFSSPAMSCEIGFSGSSREINSLALSSEKILRGSDNRLVGEFSHNSHDLHVRKLADTVPYENEHSASVSNIVPDYVQTPSTVPIPDSIQPAQGSHLYSVANDSVARVSCQPSPSLCCRTIGNCCGEPPGSSLSLSSVPTVENI